MEGWLRWTLEKKVDHMKNKRGTAKASTHTDLPYPTDFSQTNGGNTHVLNVYYMVGLALGTSCPSPHVIL